VFTNDTGLKSVYLLHEFTLRSSSPNFSSPP